MRLPSGWANWESDMIHVPVLANEVLHYLDLRPGRNYIDATADGGGHTVTILKSIQPGGKLLALEWDEELFVILRQKISCDFPDISKNCVLQRASFTRIGEIVRQLKFRPVWGVLFDLGLSSYHLELSRRGFSFQKPEERLDMRFSRDLPLTAADIIRKESASGLEKILNDFGQERFSRRIARHITAERRRRPVRNVAELVGIIRQATPSWYGRGRRHFATKVFQALRIAVNHELENIRGGLIQALDALEPGGIIVTIAFHSLEDAVIKKFSHEQSGSNRLKIITKKPVQPAAEELGRNSRARPAKLRAFEKL